MNLDLKKKIINLFIDLEKHSISFASFSSTDIY